jgi:hypothetical protein
MFILQTLHLQIKLEAVNAAQKRDRSSLYKTQGAWNSYDLI